MKASQRDFAGMAARVAKTARLFFFCGPDEAGAQDAAMRIATLIDNPGERVELSGSELSKDPVRLGDEARSTSLFGDSRHILVRCSGDDVHEAVQTLLGGEVEPCPVLIVATNATDKSKVAKLLADRPDALVAMFYPPDLKAMTDTVRQQASAAGVRLDAALAERIARATGLDSRLSQSEVTKLALYLDAGPERPRTADDAALDAITASTEEDGFMPIVNAALGGEAHKLPGELRRLDELGLNAVAVLLAVERRVAQLAQLAARMGPRGDITDFIKAEQNARRVFWKDTRDLGEQLRRWRGPRLARLVDKTMALHRAMLTNSQNADLLLAQGLTEIARAASRGG